MKCLAAWCLLVLTALWQPALAAAAANKTPSGVTVSPAFQQVQVQASELQHDLHFTITNNDLSVENIQLTTQDFNALSDSGGLFFVGTNPTALQKKYGLASWLQLPVNSVTVLPKQTVEVTASILNQPSLAPGGHYGALMLGLSSNDSSGGRNKIAVHPVASSLLFVNKAGGDIHSLKLSSVQASHGLFELPSSVILTFHNDGNTHVVPRGLVTLTSPKGKLVSQGVINESSGLLLPGLDRKLTVALKTVSAASLPGRYKLTVNFRFDGLDQYRTYQTFLSLTSPLWLIFFCLLGAVPIGLGTFFFLKRRRGRPKKPSER